LLRLGDAQGALTILEAIAVEDNDFQTKRSRAYEMLGDPQSALAIARSAAAHQPRNPALQRRVGSLALQTGSPGEALVALEAARALGDKEISTLVDLSRALLQTNRVSAALRPLDEALQRVAQGAPDDAGLHVQRGRVLLAIEDWTEARRSFERAVALNGASTASPPSVESARRHAEAWAGLAEAYARLASPSAALPYARHALELVPSHGDFIRLVGRLLYEVRDYASARETLLKDRASEPATLRLRLQVELAAEQWAAAVPLAARCYAIAPNDLRITAEYGMALLYAGQAQEALPLLEMACAAPDAAPGWLATLGRCHMRLGAYDAAVAAFTRSLEGQPDNARTHADLAGAHIRQGSYAAAAHALRQALELGGERVELRAALARSYAAQGWYSEALAEWERARQLAPGETTIRLEIARTRLELGDPEAALVDLEGLVADHPDHAVAWQLLSRAALAAGTPSRAVYAASCALSQKPHDARLRMLLAEAAIADGDARRAYETLTPLVEAPEPNVKALLLVHKAANKLGDAPAGRAALEKAGHVAPGDPDVQLAFGEQYLTHGERERAVKLLRNLLTRFGDNAPIAAAIAGQALRAQELGLARQAAERAVSLSPQDATYARLLGVICFEDGDRSMARRALQQAMKGRPEPTTAFMLGKLALERNETTEAVRYLRVAYEHRPDDPETCGWLALALRHPLQPVIEDEAPEPQRNPALDFAVRLLRQAEQAVPCWRAELGWTLLICGEYHEALGMLGSAARAEDLPDEYRAITLRRVGLILLRDGRAGDARTPLERAHELDPSDATVCSLLGQVDELQGDFATAIQSYSRAVALHPDNGRYHLRLGLAQLTQGQAETALEHLGRAAELEPARAQVWTAFSKALLKAGQLERAATCSSRAVQLGPEDGAAWRQHAAVAEAHNNIRGALEALERAVEHAPGAPEDKEWLIYYANLAIANGETERGRDALQSASNLDPNDADLLHELAQLYGAGERLALLQRAVELKPDKAAWRTELARLLVDRGEHRAALDHLKRAIVAEPRQAGAWLALAQAYRQIGDDEAAEATLRRADAEAGPDAEIFIAMGRLLETQDRWEEALQVYIEAMQLHPTADRHTDCGRCLKVLGRYDEAEQALKMALDL
ncbi:MAG TPA: tetratricopeptide repeat protein, partial [Herpetosiphonaceae bacterium]|nr:tetratricopeptide repeat protein [Herpetosiphonaceae bacterium]